MLCEIHQNQEQIFEPLQQFTRHLDIGSFLLEKQAFAEAEDQLGCAFELYERGLVPQHANVISCFVRLVQALEAQQKDDLVEEYLDKGKQLDFEKLATRPSLHLVDERKVRFCVFCDQSQYPAGQHSVKQLTSLLLAQQRLEELAIWDAEADRLMALHGTDNNMNRACASRQRSPE